MVYLIMVYYGLIMVYLAMQLAQNVLSLVFIYRNSSAILIVGDHWRVKCFVLSYKFSSPVAADNTSPRIPDELRYMKTRLFELNYAHIYCMEICCRYSKTDTNCSREIYV